MGDEVQRRREVAIWNARKLGWKCVVSLALFFWGSASDALTFYVSREGNDSWDGRSLIHKNATGPFSTIERARDAVRSMRDGGRTSGEQIVVEIQEGTYRLTRPLRLGAGDGGESGRPIVYRSARGAKVRIVGAVAVDNFGPVDNPLVLERMRPKARSYVQEARLGGLVDEQSFGSLIGRGHSTIALAGTSELFFRGRPMVLARWPNDRYSTILDLSGSTSYRFSIIGAGHQSWTKESEIWAHGYWYWDWADEWLPIVSVDEINNVAVVGNPFSRYGIRPGQRFYFSNLLAELDSPGEWFIDRKVSKVYFWSPLPRTLGDVEVSVLGGLVSIDGANFLEFDGLTFEMSRGNGIVVRNAKGVRIRNSVVRNVQGYAIRFENCVAGGVFDSEISDTGEGGIVMMGGNREVLSPGALAVENSHVYRFGRWAQAMRPAIWLAGVGNKASHNHIHDGPSVGVYFEGNDHVIEFNEVDHVGLDTDDVGAIYTGRDWAGRGNVVRNNYVHDVEGMRVGAMGVYVDDQASGVNIESNIFARVQHPVLLGGGRDNHVVDNVFIGTGVAVLVDNRGMMAQKGFWSDPNGEIRKKLEAVPWNREPYLSRYPELARALIDHPGAPVGTLIAGNFSVGQQVEAVADAVRPFVEVGKNYTLSESQTSLFAGAVARIGFGALADLSLYGGSPEIKAVIDKTRAAEIGPRCGGATKACMAVE